MVIGLIRTLTLLKLIIFLTLLSIVVSSGQRVSTLFKRTTHNGAVRHLLPSASLGGHLGILIYFTQYRRLKWAAGEHSFEKDYSQWSSKASPSLRQPGRPSWASDSTPFPPLPGLRLSRTKVI